jgi:hypothetical protein
MERLLASPKTTAVLPAKSIIILFFLHGAPETAATQLSEYQREIAGFAQGNAWC